MGNTAPSAETTLVGSRLTLRHGDSCSIDKELAKGGFSVVCACTRASDGKKLALKRIITQNHEAEQEALGEVRAHALLGNDKPCSDYIVPLLETHIHKAGPSNREISLFFPLYRRGSLSDFLLGLNEKPMDEKLCLNLFLTCAKAVSAAHSKGIAHCDIKAMNFMMVEEGSACVFIDFGSARGPPLIKKIDARADAVKEQERAERFCSAAYRAPELWEVPHKGHELDFAKSDVFALGCVLYSMTFPPYGYSPFESPSQGILALGARTATFSFPEQSSTMEIRGARKLVSQMLAFDPAKRPTAEEVVQRAETLLKEIAEEDFDVDFAAPSTNNE